MPIPRSAAGPTTVLTDATLLAEMGSNWLPLIAEVAVTAPSAAGTTTTVAVAEAPLGSVPMVHKPPPVVIDPLVTVADRTPAPAGKTFVTVTPVPVLGPLFVTEIV